MTVRLDPEVASMLAALPSVRDAGAAGKRIIEMWPLTEAKYMDNDAKYAESLQVRVCRSVAEVLLGQSIAIADAEFVYEGAESIPGREQSEVDALIGAINAYDDMADYSRAGDVELVLNALDSLGLSWDADQWQALDSTLREAESAIADELEPNNDERDLETQIIDRLLIAVSALSQTVQAVIPLSALGEESDALTDGEESIGTTGSGHDGQDGLPAAARESVVLMPYIDEVCERLAIPRIYVSSKQWPELVRCVTDIHEFTLFIAQAAKSEWDKHYEDLVWDKDEAKKLAKEEDERKNKEALAAKFAHVEGKQGGEEVEL